VILAALRGLGAHRVWAAIAGTCVLAGVASLSLLMAIGDGASTATRPAVQGLDSNLIVVDPAGASTSGVQLGFGSGSSLTEQDVEALGHPGVLSDAMAVAPTAGAHTQALALNRSWGTDVIGSTDNFAATRGYEVAEGRLFSAAEVHSGASVVVVGQTVVNNVFAGQDPIGRWMRINLHPYRVIGVFQQRGLSGSYNQDDLALIPLTAAWAYLLPVHAPHVQQVLIAVTRTDAVARTEREVTRVLLERHRISDPAQADFQVNSQSALLSAADRLAAVMRWLLAAVAAVALLGGGAGIASAVRSPLSGPNPSAVLLTGAVLLAALGAVAGVAVGAVVAGQLPRMLPDLAAPVLSAASVLGAVGVALAIGVLAGLVSAARVARMPAMAASPRA
jgi:putative ABC transport system permease protein